MPFTPLGGGITSPWPVSHPGRSCPSGGLQPPFNLRLHVDKTECGGPPWGPTGFHAVWSCSSTSAQTYPPGGSIPWSGLTLQGGPIINSYACMDPTVGHPTLRLCFFTWPFDTDTLIGFNISLLMDYVNIAPLLFFMIDTIVNINNDSWDTCADPSPLHKLESITHMPPDISDDTYGGLLSKALDTFLTNLFLHLPPDSCSHLLFYVDVYINNFVTLLQGVSQRNYRFNVISLLQPTASSFKMIPDTPYIRRPNILKTLTW